jgi:hypothetical protein
MCHESLKKIAKPFHHGLIIILKEKIGRKKLIRKKKKNLNQLG